MSIRLATPRAAVRPRAHVRRGLTPRGPITGMLLILLASLGLPPSVLAGPRGADGARDPEERALCQQINVFRDQHGLTRLRLSSALTRSAQWLSDDMARKDYFDHVDSFGRATATRLRSFGYRGATMGENLGGGASSAAATLQQWRQSPPHRLMLLRPGFRVLGIGRAHLAGTMLDWYWTATFGGTLDRSTAC
jgi:uncharacterized protein YkwD